MVERFHRTLKERLMARQAGPSWMDHLSVVLMGIRASIREDSLVSPAELVFGAPFRLPGAVFDTAQDSQWNVEEFVRTLRSHLASLAPHPVLYHRTETGSVPRSLLAASAVFLRIDAVRRPLEPPYEGPFEVLLRGPKTFTIRRGSKDVVVSVDRLKPAFNCLPGPVLEETSLRRRVPMASAPSLPARTPPPALPPSSSSSASPVVTTRSGRVSRPAVRFADI